MAECISTEPHQKEITKNGLNILANISNLLFVETVYVNNFKDKRQYLKSILQDHHVLFVQSNMYQQSLGIF